MAESSLFLEKRLRTGSGLISPSYSIIFTDVLNNIKNTRFGTSIVRLADVGDLIHFTRKKTNSNANQILKLLFKKVQQKYVKVISNIREEKREKQTN